jgi:hypothetical protein
MQESFAIVLAAKLVIVRGIKMKFLYPKITFI